MSQDNLTDANQTGDLPRSPEQPTKQYYKVIGTDLYKNKRVIPEGSIVDFFEPSFAAFLVPIDEHVVSSTVHSETETVALKSGRGRPRKNN